MALNACDFLADICGKSWVWSSEFGWLWLLPEKRHCIILVVEPDDFNSVDDRAAQRAKARAAFEGCGFTVSEKKCEIIPLETADEA